MKNLFVLFLSIVSLNLVSAQDDPAKLAKSAGKAFTSYNIDPVGNASKLDESRTKIDEALKDATVAGTFSAWQTKGDIYNAITTKELAMKQLKPEMKLSMLNPALESFKGYSKALELAVKKYEKSDAVKGLQEICNHLNNCGIINYQSGDFGSAMESFEARIKTNELVVANGQKPLLEKQKDIDDTKYLAALSAVQSKNQAKADQYFDELYKTKYPEAAVYQGVFDRNLAAGKENEAKMALEEGRKAFPDDNGLMFAEINYYLKQNKLDELTGRLELAIAKEPSNVTLYTTLGNVYDNLYQRELEAKNDAKAVDYFDKANKYYSEALTKDAKNVDAIYSLGALYYNKAAVLTKSLNALPDDTKSETLRQYETLKTQIFALFDQSLPYFKRAESLDPDDKNTLIALKEIFAKKDELELSIEFKKRLEVLESGKKNEKSYFQN